MRVNTRVLALALGAVFCFSAFAEKSIKFSGRINPSKVDRLLGSINRALGEGETDIMITLNSEGGNLGSAFKATRTIKRLNRGGANIQTKVVRYCGSACTVMFTAGAKRWARTGARFMFHSPKVESGGLSKVEKRKIEARYRRTWLNSIRSVDYNTYQWLVDEGALESDRETTVSARRLATGYVSHFL